MNIFLTLLSLPIFHYRLIPIKYTFKLYHIEKLILQICQIRDER